MVDKDEEIIGVAGDPDQFRVQGYSAGRIRCSNCNKGKHSLPNKMRCNLSACECPCLTHYVSRDGTHLIPYGSQDPFIHADVARDSKRDEGDEFIDQINDNFRNRKK